MSNSELNKQDYEGRLNALKYEKQQLQQKLEWYSKQNNTNKLRITQLEQQNISLARQNEALRVNETKRGEEIEKLRTELQAERDRFYNATMQFGDKISSVDSYKTRISSLQAALSVSLQQIEALHVRFGKTATGQAVLNKYRPLLENKI